jgi:adenylate cyclase
VDPTPDEAREQLQRLLASDVFAGAGRARSLLRYLVTRTLAGDGDQLKEYVVGVDVFERGDQFDPRIDTIVRVEARRLRAKLDEYYSGPGASDSVRIDIPRGSYVAEFSTRTALAAQVPESPPPEPQARESLVTAPPRRVRAWMAAALVAAAAGVATWMVLGPAGESPAGAEVTRVVVLPLAHFSSDADVALIASRLTDGVTTELARMTGLSVVSRTTAAGFASERQPIREVARALDVQLVMEGSVIVEAGGVHAVMRLVDATRDQKVWVGEYDSPPDQLVALQRRIATEVAAAILERRSRPQ